MVSEGDKPREGKILEALCIEHFKKRGGGSTMLSIAESSGKIKPERKSLDLVM